MAWERNKTPNKTSSTEGSRKDLVRYTNSVFLDVLALFLKTKLHRRQKALLSEDRNLEMVQSFTSVHKGSLTQLLSTNSFVDIPLSVTD